MTTTKTLRKSKALRAALSADVLERIKNNIEKIGDPGDIRELKIDKDLHGIQQDPDTNRFYTLCNALVRIYDEKSGEDETPEAEAFFDFLDYYPEEFIQFIDKNFGPKWAEVASMLIEYEFI